MSLLSLWSSAAALKQYRSTWTRHAGSVSMTLLRSLGWADRTERKCGLAHATRRSRDGRGGSSVMRPPGSVAPENAAPRLVIERLTPFEAALHREAWTALVGHCLEPNVFLDPDFALPAAQHLAGARRPDFILVWIAEPSGRRTLVAVCPVERRRGLFHSLSRAWFHDMAALGFPLLDRDHADAALRGLLAWCQPGLPRSCGLVFRAVPDPGPTADLLVAAAASVGLEVAVIARWERAVLRRDGVDGRQGLPAVSAKGAKELRRLRKRLADRGTLAYDHVSQGEALREAVEQFLVLEARGWKGRAGTALLASPSRTAFTRTMTRLLGRRGLCRVDSLTLDGVPVAMALVLRSGETDFFWKMAYAEDLARFSPGVQLVLDLTTVQLGLDRVAITDSCAAPHHPMIDRLWRDRLALSDLAIASRSGRSIVFRVSLAAERAARRGKSALKQAIKAWRPRRGGTAAVPRP